MGKLKGLPSWLHEDNPFSNYGALSVDLLKSPQYQSLSCAARQMLCVMIAHAHDEGAIKSLYNAILELDGLLGLETPKTDIENAIYGSSYRYFVLPAKQVSRYGYSSAYSFKLRQELERKGFIETMVRQKRIKRVNIFAFSTNWKSKNWVFVERKGDFVVQFWTH